MALAETTFTTYLLKHGAIVLFAGLTHALVAYRNNQSRTFMDFLILIIISSFGGVMMTLLGFQIFGLGSYLAYCCSGVGGFMGIEVMSMITKYVSDKIK